MVKTFGTEQSELKTVEVVQFCVYGKNDVFVEALCTPVVCSPLTNQRIEFVKENYPHLTGLELADNTDGQSELKIDIFIGMDYYFSFFTGKKRQGISGPVAIESVTGWILGGGGGGEVIGPLLEIMPLQILVLLL